MTLFLLIFFLLYGSMHLYVFLKARAALAFNMQAGIGLAVFMLRLLFIISTWSTRGVKSCFLHSVFSNHLIPTLINLTDPHYPYSSQMTE